MKLMQAVTLLSVMVASSLTPVFAQSSAAMRVTVPFAFFVGNEKFVAGEYAIQSATENGVVYIQGAGHSAAVLTAPLASAEPEAKANVVFANTGDGARLVKIQMEGEPSRSVPFRGNVSGAKLSALR